MALRLSTGLRDALLDRKAAATNLMTATTISFEEGTGTDSRDRIVDSGDGLGDFVKRGKVTVVGSTLNNDTFEILAVAAGYLEIAAGSLTTEAVGDQVVLAGATGGSLSDLFQNCVIDVYSGSQPSDADSAETGTKLVPISLSGGTFTGGSATNGINFGEVSDGVLSKEDGETWSGTGDAAGTAGWFRVYDNNYTTGASDTAIRMDGTVATSGGQFNMTYTAITVGGTTAVTSVSITMPAS